MKLHRPSNAHHWNLLRALPSPGAVSLRLPSPGPRAKDGHGTGGPPGKAGAPRTRRATPRPPREGRAWHGRPPVKSVAARTATLHSAVRLPHHHHLRQLLHRPCLEPQVVTPRAQPRAVGAATVPGHLVAPDRP